MMCNTRYLPENFEQRKLEKTVLQHFSYNLNVHSRWAALIQDGRKTMTALIVSQDLSPFGLNLSPIFQRLPATAMSNNDFLTTDVIYFLTNAKITFSQWGATDLQKTVFGSGPTPGLIKLILGQPTKRYF